MEAIQRDYRSKGVRFFYVYKTLAHPETNAFIRPFNLQERLLHVLEAKRRMGTEFTWICDTMESDVKRALGEAPNSEFVIDPQGLIVRKRVWSSPEELRNDLIELVGPIEHPTETVEIDFRSPDQDAERPASGVLERVKADSSTFALNIEPLRSEHPFYVKLRAEADDDLLDSGEGQMYLGFHIDPIYQVHWNNLAEPPHFELTLPEGVTASPQSASGPKMDVEADIDPREFLIDVSGFSTEPILLTVRYFACDDAETFCVRVEQQYKIHPVRDPEGGWVFARGGRPGSRRRPPVSLVRRESESISEPTAEAGERETVSTATTGASSSESATHIEGRIVGRIDGQVQAWLQGRFRGRLDGTFDDAQTKIEGRIGGLIEGRFQGRLEGEFEGEFRGYLGAP